MIDVDKILKNTRTLLVLVLVEYANEWKSMNHLVVVVVVGFLLLLSLLLLLLIFLLFYNSYICIKCMLCARM